MYACFSRSGSLSFFFSRQIFDKNGTLKHKFGMLGKLNGQLFLPSKVAVLSNDYRLLVADTGVERLRLQIFSENGIFINKIPFL